MRPTILAPVLGVALAVAACGGGESLDQRACPTGGTTLTYESFGRSFFDGWCNRCHAAPEGDRNGAPPNVTFVSHDDVLQWKTRIFARAADDNATMPVGPDGPSSEERHQLGDWLACGAP